jgi:transposase
MNEHYIGVDLHKAFLQVCAVSASGEREWEQRFPRTAEGFAALIARCDRQTAMAVEASTPTWHFADVITPHVGELRVVDSVKTKLKAGYAAKTDRLDARRLADALRRDSVVGIYVPPMAIRELRELCRGRHTLVQTRTRLLQRLRATLLRHGVVEAQRLVQQDAVLDTLALPPHAAASVASLRRVLALVRTEIRAVEHTVLTLARPIPLLSRCSNCLALARASR